MDTLTFIAVGVCIAFSVQHARKLAPYPYLFPFWERWDGVVAWCMVLALLISRIAK